MISNEATEVITALEAARLLRIDRDKVYQLLDRGQIPGRKVGGQWRIRRDRLMAWLEETR